MNAPTVSEATVTTGSISTTVSGSGILTDADTQQIVLPKGVKLEKKILVKAGETVKKGDALATVELSSVMGAMSTVQAELNKLDEQLRAATGETVQPYITTGVNGRVKIVYAQKDDDVSACMMEHGALAVLSLDGYMAVDIDAGSRRGRQGQRDRRRKDVPRHGGQAPERQGDRPPHRQRPGGRCRGQRAGCGRKCRRQRHALYPQPAAHHRLRGRCLCGKHCREPAGVRGQLLFTLRDTAYSANYESVLKNRREKEEDLMALLGMYSAGAVTAPFDGSVSSIDYSDKAASSSDNTDSSAGGGGMVYGGMMNAYASYGPDGSDSSGDGSSSSGSTAASGETSSSRSRRIRA